MGHGVGGLIGLMGEAPDAPMREPCRVSFVVTTRNDDFGGDMLRRLQLFLENVTILCDRERLEAEVIVVEWNPPDGPRLADSLRLRHHSPHVAVRFVEVPPAFHHSLRNADMLPLFQMIAKNVGIRRAHGEFVVATNQDILFSPELIRALAREDLDRNAIYRADRTDVAAEVPDDASVDEQIRFARAHILRVHTRVGTLEGAPFWNSDLPWSQRARGLGAWLRARAGAVRAWSASFSRRRRSNASGDALGRRLLRLLERMGHFLLSAVARTLAFGGRALKGVAKLVIPGASIHTNACGDFTMLARENWLALRGYPEIPLYSLHIDSFFCHVAAAAGLRERMLRPPCRVFHLEHASSWAVLDPAERIEWFAKKPWIEYGLITDLERDMQRRGEPYLYNGEGWGFGKETFPETVLRDGRVERVPAETGRGTPPPATEGRAP